MEQENAKSFHYSTLLKILWVVDLLTIFKEQRVLEQRKNILQVCDLLYHDVNNMF